MKAHAWFPKQAAEMLLVPMQGGISVGSLALIAHARCRLMIIWRSSIFLWPNYAGIRYCLRMHDLTRSEAEHLTCNEVSSWKWVANSVGQPMTSMMCSEMAHARPKPS